GMIRNLEPSEMLEQVMRAQADTGKRVSNVVLMGTGEPLDNFDNVIKFIKLLNDEHGLNIGMRHISLSTCGLCDKIDELAHLKLQITLSVSLHAADDVTRSGIMPINNKYNINTLIETCKRYFMETSRRISFEYTMISGVSDTEEQARKLSAVLAGMPCHVNLIPLNRIANSELKPSEPAQIDAFTQILENAGVTVTTRRSLGSDIDAACGQLVRSVASDIEARGDLK
ncbi:MAG: radical SAM protein, partial [Clostridia bacterium]